MLCKFVVCVLLVECHFEPGSGVWAGEVGEGNVVLDWGDVEQRGQVEHGLEQLNNDSYQVLLFDLNILYPSMNVHLDVKLDVE